MTATSAVIQWCYLYYPICINLPPLYLGCLKQACGRAAVHGRFSSWSCPISSLCGMTIPSDIQWPSSSAEIAQQKNVATMKWIRQLNPSWDDFVPFLYQPGLTINILYNNIRYWIILTHSYRSIHFIASRTYCTYCTKHTTYYHIYIL